MSGELSIDAFRAALRGTEDQGPTEDDVRLEQMAQRFERAVQTLMADIQRVVQQIPEFKVTLEDEVETFESPAFPGKSLDIHDQRLRITHGEDVLLFDPTAKALLSALGQVEVSATRPIPFMVDKVLYLIPDKSGSKARWGFRSVEDIGGALALFTQQSFMRMLQCVFLGD